ncbi:hypothetical protein [Bacteroides acidifaciens]|uniref:hypothetical protein n=1 Tax=Bacteroides acidifaciens TaxID=85831 RepID=UPI0026F0E563|nr:hypothetical protein [Bacteroides acidifaciens]
MYNLPQAEKTVRYTEQEKVIIYTAQYDDLSYLDCLSQLRWVQTKLVRAKHDLYNVLDIMHLTDHPSNDMKHMKYELTENIKDLTARVKSLNRRIYIYENKGNA